MPPIPEWLGGATGWLGGIAAIVLLVAFFWKPARLAWRRGQSLAKFLDDWNGTPAVEDHAGYVIEEARPGVAARIFQLEERVEKIHHEVTPNHGGSMNDAQRRTEADVKELGRKLDEHITIAKASDESNAETAELVQRIASRWVEN